MFPKASFPAKQGFYLVPGLSAHCPNQPVRKPAHCLIVKRWKPYPSNCPNDALELILGKGESMQPYRLLKRIFCSRLSFNSPCNLDNMDNKRAPQSVFRCSRTMHNKNLAIVYCSLAIHQSFLWFEHQIYKHFEPLPG